MVSETPKKRNLTAEVEETLTKEIMLGVYPPGGIFPSEFESVKRFQVSRVTIRRAYANMEKKGILIRKIRQRTVVSDRLTAAVEPISLVGALLPLNHAFSRLFLEGVNQEATQEKALIVLAPPFANAEELNRAALELVSGGVRNLIVWGYEQVMDLSVFQRLRLLGVNMVFFDHVNPGKIADYVSLDNHHAIEMLIDKALQDGHEKFVFVNTSGLNVETNSERERSFVEICRSRGLDYSLDSLPWQKVLADDADAECRTFYHSLQKPDKTAIFGVNYLLVHAIYRAVDGWGHYYSISIPDDKRLPNVSTVIQPISQMAFECFERLRVQQTEGAKWKAREIRLKGIPDWRG